MVTTSTGSAGLMMFAITAWSSSAFTAPPSFSGCWKPITTTHHCPIIFSSSKLGLSAKPKAKTDRNKKNTRGGGGGGGFGTSTADKNAQQQQSIKNAQSKTSQMSTSRRRLSAAEVTRQNTAVYTRQQQQMELVEKESIKSAAVAGTDPTVRQKRGRQKWSQRHAAVDLAGESAEWKSRFIEEYLQQQQQECSSSKAAVRKVIQISQDPFLFTIDEFVDPDACRKIQNDAAGCFDLFFPEKVADVLFRGQENELDGLLFNAASSKDHNTGAMATTDHPYYPDGLHMDTNNQCLFRHVTCILYLNDIPEEFGGATVFPLARCLPDDPALVASRRLLAHKLSHTRNYAALHDFGLMADALLMESRVGTNYLQNPETDTAIRIQPKAGRLLVFFSRDSKGHEDPRAWHAGERIRPAATGSDTAAIVEKRILTLFKEVDYSSSSSSFDNGELLLESSRFPSVEGTLESFLAPQIEAQRNWLQAKAKLQRALLQG